MSGTEDNHKRGQYDVAEPMVGERTSKDKLGNSKSALIAALHKKIAGGIGGLILLVVVVVVIVVLVYTLAPSSSSMTGFDVIPGREIVYNPGKSSTYKEYVERLNQTLEPYRNVRVGGQVTLCDETTELDQDKVCIFEADWLSSCSKNNFGFGTSQPCVLLTYRNDTSFDPEVYETLDEIPKEIPKDLNVSIHTNYLSNKQELLKLVWVHCTHAYTYAPVPGFYDYYFPNKALDPYLPPVVGVVFILDDEEKKDVVCTLWSKTKDETTQRRSVSFTIQKTA